MCSRNVTKIVRPDEIVGAHFGRVEFHSIASFLLHCLDLIYKQAKYFMRSQTNMTNLYLLNNYPPRYFLLIRALVPLVDDFQYFMLYYRQTLDNVPPTIHYSGILGAEITLNKQSSVY